jgi:hypothetical protein
VSGHFGAELWIGHDQPKLFLAVGFVRLRASINNLQFLWIPDANLKIRKV